MVARKTLKFLPGIFQTDVNSKFLSATLDQLVSEPKLKNIYGYIGRKFAPTYKTKDSYIVEDTADRQNYQLEPSVVITDDQNNVTFFSSYIDLLNKIKYYGGVINDHSRLFNNEYYSFDPRISYDKFVNFTQYYWLPNGPDPVDVFSSGVDLNKDYVVSRDPFTKKYTFSESNIVNNTLYLAYGGSYTFTVDQPGHKFWIQTELGIDGKLNAASTISTREVFGVDNNGAEVGTVTFNVPQKDAQDRFTSMNTVYNVDYAAPLPYSALQNQLLSNFLAAYPQYAGITGQLNGKTLIFLNSEALNNLGEEAWTAKGVYDLELFQTQGYDAGDVVPENLRYSVWQVQFVTTGDDPLIKLAHIQNVDINEKVYIKYGLQNANKEFYKDLDGFFKQVPVISSTLDKLYIQDGTDPAIYTEIKIVDSISWSIDVENEILGKVTYTSPNGVEFTSGLKVKFDEQVTPVKYKNKEFYVENVGDSIRLVDVDLLVRPEAYNDELTINYPGEVFPEYITIKRDALDLNAWSRNNRWFHIEVIEATSKYNNSIPQYNQNLRAQRPIVQFEGDLQLFNYGRIGKRYIDILDISTTDAFNQYEGKTLSEVFGVSLTNGLRVLFANDQDPLVRNKVYEINLIYIHIDAQGLPTGDPQIKLTLAADGEVEQYDVVTVAQGRFKGTGWWYDGTQWIEAQEKTSSNQEPLFDVIDANGRSLSSYEGSNFQGTKLFGYKRNSAGVNDSVLGFPLSYRNFTTQGDIEFQNYFDTDTFNYTSANQTVSERVAFGFLANIDNRYTLRPVNNWRKVVEPSKQYQLFTFIYSDSNKFKIDITPAVEQSIPYVKVFVNNVLVNRQKIDVDLTSLTITVNNSLAVNDKVDILVYSTEVSETAFYQIPLNLDFNAQNIDLETLTLGQVRNHLVELSYNTKDLIGDILAQSNLRDIELKQQGGNILQHAAPVPYASLFLLDDTANFVNAIRYAQQEYAKFKNKFLELAATLPGINPQDPVASVDLILTTINSIKNASFPWFYSDMVPYGTLKNIINDPGYTIFNPLVKTYEITNVFDSTSLSNKAILVYLNGAQLVHGRDYTFSLTTPAIILNDRLDLEVDDLLTIVEYENTDGNYIPETPTKLGLFPKYIPEIFEDDTYRTPINVIRGHDGSLTPAFNDYRDSFLIELERRIFNNIKLPADANNFEHVYTVIEGKFRNDEYNFTEITQLLSKSFLNWLGNNKLDYSTNDTFNNSDLFTYNYSESVDRIDGENLPGSWRSCFNYFYDTDAPHLRPWEMLGFSIKPDWWEGYYGPGPYTGGNKLLWDDLEAGLIREGDRAGVDARFVRPGLSRIIPVDANGNILPPAKCLAAAFDPTRSSGAWAIGNQGPVETAWRRSSDYPYAIQVALALAKPAIYFGLYSDLSAYQTNSILNQKLTLSNNHIQQTDIKFNGDVSSGTPQRAAGYLNWIADYLINLGINPSTKITPMLKGYSVRLAYKMSGFSDQRYLQAVAEQSSPTSTNEGVIIPNENFKIHLYKSTPVDRISYSAVIVEKTSNGYSVRGYDLTNPYFTVIPSVANNKFKNISVLNSQATIFENYLPFMVTVPYGTEFTTQQQVSDFLISYERYLLSQGFNFTNVDGRLQEIRNFRLSVKEFLFWAQQGWKTGSILVLSPISETVNVITQGAIVDEIEDSQYGSRVIDQNFKVIKNNNYSVVRTPTTFKLSLGVDQAIGLVELNLVQYEHVIIFDNVTVFNDIIYKPESGNRQFRLKLIGQKTDDWDGSLYSPGFIYNSGEVQSWQGGKDYYKGELVEYKDRYYVALSNVVAADNFDFANWKEADYNKIKKGLLPNLSSIAVKPQSYYDSYGYFNDPESVKYSHGLIGFKPRQYLDDLGLNETTQVEFYKGYIKQKGSANAINALTQAQFNNLNSAIDYFEEWAIRVGEYGALDINAYIEIPLDEKAFSVNPAPAEFVPQSQASRADGITIFSDTELYKKTASLFEGNIALNRDSTSNYDNDIPTAGYVNIDDVDATIFDLSNYRELDSQLDSIGSGFTIWVAKDFTQNWNVYRVTETDVAVVEVTNSLDGFITFRCDIPHELTENDVFLVRNFDPAFDGFYKVHRLVDINRVMVAYTGDLTTLTSLSAEGVLFQLDSLRFVYMENARLYNPPHGWKAGEKIWIDIDAETTAVQGQPHAPTNTWKVYEKQFPWSLDQSLPPDTGTQLANVNYGSAVKMTDDTHTVAVGTSGFVYKVSNPNTGLVTLYEKNLSTANVAINGVRLNTSAGTATETENLTVVASSAFGANVSGWSGYTNSGNVTIALPFNVSFNGTSYGNISVSTNGYISFDTAATNSKHWTTPNQPYPYAPTFYYPDAQGPTSGTGFLGAAAIYIASWDLSGLSVQTATQGNVGTRTFTVRYTGDAYNTGPSTADTSRPIVWQVTFHEATPYIIDIVVEQDAFKSGVYGFSSGSSWLYNWHPRKPFATQGTVKVANAFDQHLKIYPSSANVRAFGYHLDLAIHNDTAIDGQSKVMAVGAPDTRGTSGNVGAVFIYNQTVGTTDWQPGQVLVGNLAATGGQFGYSFAFDEHGHWLYVGAPGSDKVYVYGLRRFVTTAQGNVNVTTSTTTITVPFTPQITNDATSLVVTSNDQTYIPLRDYTLSGTTITFAANVANVTINIKQGPYFSLVQTINSTDYGCPAGSEFGYAIDSSLDGAQLGIGAPGATVNVGVFSDGVNTAERSIAVNSNTATITVDGNVLTRTSYTEFLEAGAVYVVDRVIEAFDSTDSVIYTTEETLGNVYLVSVDDVEVFNYSKTSSNTITFTTPLGVGKVVKIETNKFTLLEKLIGIDSLSGSLSAIQQGTRFGTSFTICSNNCAFYVGAPYYDNGTTYSTGAVWKFHNKGRLYGTNTAFRRNPTFTPGDTIRLDNYRVEITGSTLDQVVADINNANLLGITAVNQNGYLRLDSDKTVAKNRLRILSGSGTFYEDAGMTVFAFMQIIINPYNTVNEYFGSKVILARNAYMLLISSERGTTRRYTTFDEGTTILDSTTTGIFDSIRGSGSVYTYELYDDPRDEVEHPGRYAFNQQIDPGDLNPGDRLGAAIDIIGGYIIVTAPSDDTNTVDGGSVYIFTNPTGGRGWKLINYQEPTVDVESVNRVYLYNKNTNTILTNLQIVDPAKGLIVGQAEQEISYKTEYDPAIYNRGSNSRANVNADIYWGENQLGKVWWDLDQVRYVDYEQSTLDYRNINWGRLFPGSTIEVLEWVESDVLPSEYVLSGGEGIPKYEDDSAYVETIFVDPTTNIVITKYYFWVKEKTSLDYNLPNRKLPIKTIREIIENPKGYGIPYVAITSSRSLIAYNISQYLSASDTILHLDYELLKNSSIIHSEYELLQKGNADYVIPAKIVTKLIDSLAGKDQGGRLVPDPNLSVADRYGISVRPRQSMFVDRLSALRTAVSYINDIFISYPIAQRFSLLKLNEQETPPSLRRGDYQLDAATEQELDYIDVSNLPAGYKVLVAENTTKDNRWTLHELTAEKTWNIIQTQSYKTDLYWDFVDWYADGYDANTKVDYSVATLVDALKLPYAEGNLIRIDNIGNGTWEIVLVIKNSGILEFSTVGAQNGTIQLTNNILNTDPLPDKEIRSILTALKDDIFIDQLAGKFNDLFFVLINYILREQTYVDWIFKTSFVNVVHQLRGLEQFPSYIRDNQTYYQEYIDEVKPYKTKIREYLINYNRVDQYQGSITDFDLAPYYDTSQNIFRSPSGELPGDAQLWATGYLGNSLINQDYTQWYQNRLYSVNEIIVTAAGANYSEPPIIEITGGGGSGATAHAVIDGDTGKLIEVVVDSPGSGYSSTPIVVVNGNGTGGRAYAVIKNDQLRNFETTIKFDRVGYTSIVKDWTANSTFTLGDIISYDGTGWLVPGNLTTGSTFVEADFVKFPAADFANANDRIMAYYNPIGSMPARDLKQLIYGIDYPGVQLTGVNFNQRPGFSGTTNANLTISAGTVIAVDSIITQPAADVILKLSGSVTVSAGDYITQPGKSGSINASVYSSATSSSELYLIYNSATTFDVSGNVIIGNIKINGAWPATNVTPVSSETLTDFSATVTKVWNSTKFEVSLNNSTDIILGNDSFTGGNLEINGTLSAVYPVALELVGDPAETLFDQGIFDQVQYDENGFPVLDDELLDTIIRSNYTDYALGSRPEDINVDGGAYVDRYSSHAPEEFVPGITFDTLNMQVYTTVFGNTVVLGHRIFVDMLRDTTYTRISSTASTRLTKDLNIDDDFIYVADAGALAIPNPGANLPGVIFINGERITYYKNYAREVSAWAVNVTYPVNTSLSFGKKVTFSQPITVIAGQYISQPLSGALAVPLYNYTDATEISLYYSTVEEFSLGFGNVEVLADTETITFGSYPTSQVTAYYRTTAPMPASTTFDVTKVVSFDDISALGQIRRGTAGTAVRNVHYTGVVVLDASADQTVPGLDAATIRVAEIQLSGNVTANIGQYITQKNTNANLRVLDSVTSSANVIVSYELPFAANVGGVGNTITVGANPTALYILSANLDANYSAKVTSTPPHTLLFTSNVVLTPGDAIRQPLTNTNVTVVSVNTVSGELVQLTGPVTLLGGSFVTQANASGNAKIVNSVTDNDYLQLVYISGEFVAEGGNILINGVDAGVTFNTVSDRGVQVAEVIYTNNNTFSFANAQILLSGNISATAGSYITQIDSTGNIIANVTMLANVISANVANVRFNTTTLLGIGSSYGNIYINGTDANVRLLSATYDNNSSQQITVNGATVEGNVCPMAITLSGYSIYANGNVLLGGNISLHTDRSWYNLGNSGAIADGLGFDGSTTEQVLFLKSSPGSYLTSFELVDETGLNTIITEDGQALFAEFGEI